MSIGGVRNLKKRGLSKYTFRTRNRELKLGKLSIYQKKNTICLPVPHM